MAFKKFSSLIALNKTHEAKCYTSAVGALISKCNLTVEHDRQNMRFAIRLSSEAGSRGKCAELRYKIIGENELDLMSTTVPECFRGNGVAALLSKAAMDFLIEENLKAHVSCWYIRKYLYDNPQVLKKVYAILACKAHPLHGEFKLLPSGRYKVPLHRTQRLKVSFVYTAITRLNLQK